MRPQELKLQAQIPSLRWLSERVWSVEHAFERAKAENRATEDTRVRIALVWSAFAAVFAVLALGAVKAAVLHGDGAGGWSLAPAAARADLVDREGRLLATNLTHYGLYLDPAEVWDTGETRRALLSALPSINYGRLEKGLRGERRIFVHGGLTPEERAKVHALGLPGVSFEEEDRRVYPLGVGAGHLIGWSDTGGRGLAGVEKAFDEEIRAAGLKGQTFSLSIDLRVQAALEDELRRAAAAQNADGAVGVITNARTGEILAVSSWPEVDPNAPAAGGPNAALNRAAASVYEMGSTFKVFTVAMGLDTGAASLDSTFDAKAPLRIGGRAISDFHAENRVMTLEDVFIHSSNIGTSRLALTMGAPAMRRYFGNMGLLAPAQVELVESARPIVPRQWNENTVASASFGHAISVSPLALSAAMGAVLNGGEYVPLTLRKLGPGEAPEGRRVVSEKTSRAMLDLMRINVVRGTGSKANAPGLRVGGKTGSAEKVIGGRYERTRLVSSFAAVFPTDNRHDEDRWFVLILMDEPKGNAETFGLRTGGWTAAPVAGRVIDRVAPFLGVSRKADPFNTAMGDKIPTPETPGSGLETGL
jgi:cell division protein FtsI (penicillin-binding protein 3)